MDDEAGVLYFFQSYRIRKITLDTGIISTVVGTGKEGNIHTNNPLTSQIGLIRNLQRWKDNLIWSENCFVNKLDLKSNQVSRIFGNGFGPESDTSITDPLSVVISDDITSVEVDPVSGDIYIGEITCIRKIDAKTGRVSIYAGNCKGSGSFSDVVLTNSAFEQIHSLKFCNGDLYLTTKNYLQKIFNKNDQLWLTTVQTSSSMNWLECFNNTLIIDFKFKELSGKSNFAYAAVDDTKGDIYIVDYTLCNIQKLSGGNFSSIIDCKKEVDVNTLPLTNFAVDTSFDDAGLYLADRRSIKFLNYSTNSLRVVAGNPVDCSNVCFTNIRSIHSANKGIFIVDDNVIKLLSGTNLTYVLGSPNYIINCVNGSLATKCQTHYAK